MRYAVNYPSYGSCADPAFFSDIARVAEETGWDAILLEDYVVRSTGGESLPGYDPWVLLAAAAMRTSRLRLGTLVTALPRRRPWKLAREVLTLDHLSGGRAILGVGLGDAKLDWSFIKFNEPTDLNTRSERADEALEIIAGLWTAQPFSFQGKHYRVDELTFLPAPVQKPRVPIWIGGTWPRRGRKAFKRALSFDGFAGFRGIPGNDDHGPLMPQEIIEISSSAAKERPNTPFDIIVGGWPRSADLDREREVRRNCECAGATWWQEWVTGAPERVREIIRSGPIRTN